MELEIPNAELTAADVPTSADDPAAVEAFAMTFDGYAHWGDRCGELAHEAANAFHQRSELPESLSDLRACLFYEQQRWRWQPADVSGRDHAYLHALLAAIRTATAPA